MNLFYLRLSQMKHYSWISAYLSFSAYLKDPKVSIIIPDTILTMIIGSNILNMLSRINLEIEKFCNGLESETS